MIITLSIQTVNMTVLSILTLNILTLSILTLSILTLSILTLSILTLMHYDSHQNGTQYQMKLLFWVQNQLTILSVIMLIVIMLSVFVPTERKQP